MDRHLVAGEIMVDEEAEALVDRELFHQRRAGAHRHRADHLTARRLRVRIRPAAQTASMRRMRVSPVAASTPTSTKCAPKVDCWYFLSRSPNSMRSSATMPLSPAAWASGTLRLPERTWPSAKHCVGGVEAELLRHGLAQLDAGGIDAGGRAIARPIVRRSPRRPGRSSRRAAPPLFRAARPSSRPRSGR